MPKKKLSVLYPVSTTDTIVPIVMPEGITHWRWGSNSLPQDSLPQPSSVKYKVSPAGRFFKAIKENPSGSSVLYPINAISPAASVCAYTSG